MCVYACVCVKLQRAGKQDIYVERKKSMTMRKKHIHIYSEKN